MLAIRPPPLGCISTNTIRAIELITKEQLAMNSIDCFPL
jgi:hypothetical protein